MDKYIKLLQNIPLFNNINISEIMPMLKCLGAYKKSYDKGNYIISADDEIKYIGIVITGSVQMIKEDIWGNKSIIANVTEGQIFGETFVCSNTLTSTVSFKARNACEVLFLQFQRIIHTCSKSCMYHHKLIENMMILIAEKNMKLIGKIEIISKKSLHEKILTYLSDQAQIKGEKYFTIPMGRLELADYLCSDRSALTRELSRMKSEGILDYDKNTFHLLK